MEQSEHNISHDRRKQVRWWQRNYLVNRDLQLKFAVSAAIVGLVSSVVSAGLLLWSFWAFNIWQGQRLPPPVLAVIAFVLLLNISGIYVTTIFATHRIVGPIFNLLRQIQRIGKGDFSATAKFRDNDEMHYVARRFNEMVEKLNVRNVAIFEKIARVDEFVTLGKIEEARATLQEVMKLNEVEREN